MLRCATKRLASLAGISTLFSGVIPLTAVPDVKLYTHNSYTSVLETQVTSIFIIESAIVFVLFGKRYSIRFMVIKQLNNIARNNICSCMLV